MQQQQIIVIINSKISQTIVAAAKQIQICNPRTEITKMQF